MLGHASAIECSRPLMSLGIGTLDKKTGHVGANLAREGGRHVRGAWQGESILCLGREASGSTHSGPQVRVLFRYALYRKPQNPIYSLSLSASVRSHNLDLC